MQRLSEFFAGLIFGLGLMLSGMTDPSKVLGFLDVSGSWDPSLAFVMCGAIAISFIAFAIAKKRNTNLLGGSLSLPNSKQIDTRLVLGNLIFGVGWGIAGFCPGPALVTMAAGEQKALVFVIAMLVGMLGYEAIQRIVHAPRSTNTEI